MAFLSMTLRDDYGRESTKRIELESQATLADYSTLATAVVTALAAISDLGIVRADLQLHGFVTGFEAVGSGSNVDVGATFAGDLVTGENRKASHKVPGIAASFVGTDGTIDITQTEIDTYLDLFLDTGAGALLSDGEQMGDWLRGSLDR